MSPKLRKFLILAHLWLAGLMAPAFALHAISGGLYLMDITGDVASERVALPEVATLDFGSSTLENDVKGLFTRAGVDHEFEAVRVRGSVIQLRPTSKPYLEFKQTPQGVTVTRKKPNFVRAMLELHKGHGPKLFRSYQKLVALLLMAVVLGGILVGFMARAYRRQTVIAVALGIVSFGLVAFVI